MVLKDPSYNGYELLQIFLSWTKLIYKIWSLFKCLALFQFLSSPQCNLLNISWLTIGFLLNLLWEKITVSLHYFTNILYLFAVWSLTTVLGRGGSCRCVWPTLVCCTATSYPALWQDSPAYAGSNKMTLTSSVPPLM